MGFARRSWANVAAAAFAGMLAVNAFVPIGQFSVTPAQPSDGIALSDMDLPSSQTTWHAKASGRTSMQGISFIAGVVGAAMLFAQRQSARRNQIGNPVRAVVATHAFDRELGVTMPFKYWDPLGLGSDGEEAAFRRRRISEIKNGRVAMIACMGYIAPEYFRWPGYLSPSAGIKFSDLPNGVAALSKVPAEGWAQIGTFIAFLELFPLRQEPDRIPGDAPGCGKLGVPWFFVAGKGGSKADPVGSERSLNAEINNGRLAMVAITGMVVQNGYLGTTGPEMWIPGSALPRAAYDASKELGACDPLLFWDPVGFCASSSAEEFKRRRAVEIKHGRVCMFAIIGMVVPDVFGKFPGELAPSLGLKFEDIPSGIAGISKVPVEGWLQILAFVGFLEISVYKDKAFGGFSFGDYGAEPGNFGFGKFGLPGAKVADKAERDKSLLAELNNGRLAMVAFTAAVTQNYLTGQSPIEQLASGHISPFNDGQGVFAMREAPKRGRTTMRAAAQQNSLALPFGPCPSTLTNNPLNEEYVGDVGFDPLGFSKNKRLLPWYREAELAHGRCAMLATLGYSIQTSGVKWEPFITKYPTTSLDPLKTATEVPVIGWLQILTLIAVSEIWRFENVIAKYGDGVKPGDLGWNIAAPAGGKRPKWFGPTFTSKYSKDEYTLLRLREIKHCRLAMVGFTFMTIQNASTGRGATLIPFVEKPEYFGTVGDFIPKNL